MQFVSIDKQQISGECCVTAHPAGGCFGSIEYQYNRILFMHVRRILVAVGF